MCLLISKVIILLCKLLNLQESIPYFDVFVSEINLLSTKFSGKGLTFQPIRSEKTVLSRL